MGGELPTHYRVSQHGYADVDDQRVCDIVETKLPVLSKEITELLEAK